MFLKESLWIRDVLASVEPRRGQIVLDIGSSTEEFRCLDQPFIDYHVFRPLRKAGLTVLHVDARSAEGVDIVCDIATQDSDPLAAVPAGHIVVCSNLLEHVVDPDLVLRRIVALTKPGGLLVVTVPYVYRWHADPIDTMYRLSKTELEALVMAFPLIVVASAEIEVDEEPVTEGVSSLPKRLANKIYRQFMSRSLFQPRVIRNKVSVVAARKEA